MRIDARNDADRLPALGYKRIYRVGSLDFFWRAPDGRVLEESAALAELRMQQDEDNEEDRRDG